MERTRKESEILCNSCGQVLQETGEKPTNQDWVSLQKTWGYFSHKDGEKHRLCICEACYDRWIQSFAVPVSVTRPPELLLL